MFEAGAEDAVLRATGALCLYRILPIVEYCDPANRDLMGSIVSALVDGEDVDDAQLDTLREWRGPGGKVHEFKSPEYLRSRIYGLVLGSMGDVIGQVGRNPTEWCRIAAVSIWGCCDQYIRMDGCGDNPILREVGASLAYIEEIWQAGDDREIRDSRSVGDAVLKRCALVDRKSAGRSEIVRAVAECVGWVPSQP